MRRGTEPAIEMGKILRSIREDRGMSMSQVAHRIGCPASTVSQIEKAQRALKAPKIEAWAIALDVEPAYLRECWNRLDAVSVEPIIRGRRKRTDVDDLYSRIKQLSGTERDRVSGYIDAILESTE